MEADHHDAPMPIGAWLLCSAIDRPSVTVVLAGRTGFVITQTACAAARKLIVFINICDSGNILKSESVIGQCPRIAACAFETRTSRAATPAANIVTIPTCWPAIISLYSTVKIIVIPGIV